jgi:hypothetical protein
MSSERKTETFSFMPGLHMCASWWPSVSSEMMSTPQELVQCVLWLAELQSLMAVQRHFRMQYGHQPPTRKSIRFWDNKLSITGSMLRVKSPRKIRTSAENINLIREAFQWSPRNSIRAASLQLLTNSTFNRARYVARKVPRTSFKWFMH